MQRPLTVIVMAAAFAFSFASAASAQTTRTVCAAGCQYTSIIAAIDASVNGDIIQLSAETYSEGSVIDTDGKAITLRGATDKKGAAASILNGNNAHRVLQCSSGEGADTRFENLVIQNGSAGTGGGMLNQGSSPTLVNCLFTGNRSNQDGAALRNLNAGASITNCTFSDNGPGREGGAIYHDSGVLILSECSFMRNECEFSGGALYLAGEDCSVSDCTFTENRGSSG